MCRKPPPIYASCMTIGNRTPLSDGRKKEIYRDVRFFHKAIQLIFGSQHHCHSCCHSESSNHCHPFITISIVSPGFKCKSFISLSTTSFHVFQGLSLGLAPSNSKEFSPNHHHPFLKHVRTLVIYFFVTLLLCILFITTAFSFLPHAMQVHFLLSSMTTSQSAAEII